MKFNILTFKKLSISLGAMTALTVPIVTAVACGTSGPFEKIDVKSSYSGNKVIFLEALDCPSCTRYFHNPDATSAADGAGDYKGPASEFAEKYPSYLITIKSFSNFPTALQTMSNNAGFTPTGTPKTYFIKDGELVYQYNGEKRFSTLENRYKTIYG